MNVRSRREAMARPPEAPWSADHRLAWVGAALFVFSVVATGAWLSGTWMIDLQVYRAGGDALLHGRNLYLAHPDGSFLQFTYPPFAAIVFGALAVLPNLVAQLAITALSAAALLIVAILAVQTLKPAWPRRLVWTVALAISAAAPLLEPVRDTLWFGQVNLVLMALVMVDIIGRRDAKHGGVLVGVATAIKLTPAIFILYLLATRRVRAALTAAVTASALTVVAFALAPAASWRYWTNVIFDDRRVGDVRFVWDQSLRGAITRAFGSGTGTELLWLIVAALVLAAGLAVAVRVRSGGDELLGLGIAAVTGLLVSPISWDHHWVWALPVAVSLWWRQAQRGTRSGLALSAAWTATFGAVSLWWWARPGPRDLRMGWTGVLADSYVLLGVALVAWAGWDNTRSRTSAPAASTL
jgi:alpha-1,2-mannosyltransferase